MTMNIGIAIDVQRGTKVKQGSLEEREDEILVKGLSLAELEQIA